MTGEIKKVKLLLSYSLWPIDVSRLAPVNKALLDVAWETLDAKIIFHNLMVLYQVCNDWGAPPRSYKS